MKQRQLFCLIILLMLSSASAHPLDCYLEFRKEMVRREIEIKYLANPDPHTKKIEAYADEIVESKISSKKHTPATEKAYSKAIYALFKGDPQPLRDLGERIVDLDQKNKVVSLSVLRRFQFSTAYLKELEDGYDPIATEAEDHSTTVTLFETFNYPQIPTLANAVPTSDSITWKKVFVDVRIGFYPQLPEVNRTHLSYQDLPENRVVVTYEAIVPQNGLIARFELTLQKPHCIPIRYIDGNIIDGEFHLANEYIYEYEADWVHRFPSSIRTRHADPFRDQSKIGEDLVVVTDYRVFNEIGI